MKWKTLFIFVITFKVSLSIQKEGQCEVCQDTVTTFRNTLTPETLSDPQKIEDAFRAFCEKTVGKQNKICYFLGGLKISATGILGELSKPLSWGLASDKICERLKRKDSQICEIRYAKQIDLNNVDLKKLKVKDLKQILYNWDAVCDGCLEKVDFIKKIEELKPKYMRSEL